MENLPKKEILDSTLISDIEPVEEGGITVPSKEYLKNFVEYPLLEACELLFDKGIRTIFSSANKKDLIIGHAHIALDWEQLSPANQQIAEKLGEEGIIHGSRTRKGIYLQIPVTRSSTVGDIKEQALTLVNQFENQEL